MGARTLSKKTGPRQRVLCFAGANREKGDRTPWEWKGRDPDWWAASRSGSSMRGEWLEQPDDFYFRAGALLDWPKETRFKDEDCSSSSPAALYGCGNGIDGAPLSSLGDFEARAGFELGVGYAAGACPTPRSRPSVPPELLLRGTREFHSNPRSACWTSPTDPPSSPWRSPRTCGSAVGLDATEALLELARREATRRRAT